MRIVVGSDHAGFQLKETLKQWLQEHGHDVLDVGTHSEDRCDYPDFGLLVGQAVARGDAERGVAVCGSGQGICMAANKVPGIRGGVIRDDEDAELTRRHNDANVACFGERQTDAATAISALAVFLSTGFDGGRHEARVQKLARLDESHGTTDL